MKIRIRPKIRAN